MINKTKELRIQKGKFTSIKTGDLNQPSHCQACGSDKPENLSQVVSEDGLILWVGYVCKAVLTDERIPSLNDGELWTVTNKNNQTIEFVKLDKAMIAELKQTKLTLIKNGQKQGDLFFNSVNSAITKKTVTLQMKDNLLWTIEECKNW